MCSLHHVVLIMQEKKPEGLIACLVAQRGHEHIVGMEAWQRGLMRKVRVRANQALHALAA